jgi:hypothetical protein
VPNRFFGVFEGEMAVSGGLGQEKRFILKHFRFDSERY